MSVIGDYRAQRVLDASPQTHYQTVTLTLLRVGFLAGFVLVSALLFRAGSFTWGDLLLFGSVLLTVALFPGRVCSVPMSLPLRVSAAAMVIGGALATAVSPEPVDSALVLFRVVLLAVVLPQVVHVVFPTARELRWAFVATGAGAALNGAVTVAQFAGLQIGGSEGFTNADRFMGLTLHVSDAGGITAMGAVIGLGLLGRHRWRALDAVALAVLALSLVGVILSGSVSGMLATIVGFIVIAAFGGLSGRKLTAASVGAVIAAVVGTVLVTLTSNGLSPIERTLQVLGLTGGHQGTNTVASRTVTIERGWAGFSQHPWTGAGLDARSSTVWYDLAVHNLPVGLLYAGGIFFAFGVLGIITVHVSSGIARAFKQPLLVLALGLVAAELVFAMTAPSLYNRYLWVPVALLAVAASGQHRAWEER